MEAPQTPGTWEVSSQALQDIGANHACYLDQVRLRPQFDPRIQRQIGVRIDSRSPDPAFERLGLRKRDVIVRINGRPIKGAIDVTSLLRANRGAARMVVEFIRQGEPMRRTYILRGEGRSR